MVLCTHCFLNLKVAFLSMSIEKENMVVEKISLRMLHQFVILNEGWEVGGRLKSGEMEERSEEMQSYTCDLKVKYL